MKTKTVGFFENAIVKQIQNDKDFNNYPKVPVRIRCGWHFRHSLDGIYAQVLSSVHGWVGCDRCGYVAQTWSNMYGGYNETPIGYLHSANPSKRLIQIVQLQERKIGVRRK